MSADASWSCAVARIARPIRVRLTKSWSATIRTIARTKMKIERTEIDAPADRDLPAQRKDLGGTPVAGPGEDECDVLEDE